MKPLRVLIADDEPITSQYLKILLQRFPNLLLIGTTTTGRETLKFLHQNHLDLIFLDVVMPDLSGIDILRQFNKTSSLTPPLFIMLTAHEQFTCAAYHCLFNQACHATASGAGIAGCQYPPQT